MGFWTDVAWLVGGAVMGAPIAAALSSLPSTTGEGVSLRLARHNARQATDWRVWATLREIFGSGKRKAPPSDDDVWGGLFLGVVVVLIIVKLYVENVVSIAVILFWAAVLVLLVTTVVFLVLWWRRVFDGKGAFWALLLTVPFAAMGSLVAYWLLEPPLRGVLEPALAALSGQGISGLFPYLTPLLLQILGAMSCFALLVGSFAYCAANVAAALHESRARGARWWTFVFWASRWTTGRGAIWGFVVLALFTLFSASGLAAEWIVSIQERAGQAL